MEIEYKSDEKERMDDDPSVIIRHGGCVGEDVHGDAFNPVSDEREDDVQLIMCPRHEN